MTIDEAIENFKTIAKNARNDIIDSDDLEPQEKHYNSQLELYAKENEQIEEWLEELKCYKNDNDFSEYSDRLHKIAFHSGYNKAIDDFVEKISLGISESIIYGMLVDSRKYNGFNDTPDKIVDYVVETSKEIAEQLKAGESE